MSKKFINPNWKALRKVSEKLQRCFFYCWDKADAAGVYEMDTAYMQADLGFSVSFDELLKLPLVKNIGSEKLLFEDYLDIQTGGILKDGYNPHKPIFRAIDFHGSEHFFDLDLKIETGVKENKKIQAIKYFFKLKNKTTELVDEGEYEDEKEKEKEKEGKGEKEGGAEGTMLVPQMLTLWKKQKPNYPEDRDKDYQALRHIAQFICKQESVSFQPQEPDIGKLVLQTWSQLVQFICSDSFYNSKSLTSVSFNIQSISMSIQNAGTKTSKAGAGKVTGAGLNEALAKFRGQGQAAGSGG